jgi:hypothetical protein
MRGHSVSPQGFIEYRMPPPWLLINLLLYNLDHDFVRSLFLTISLGIIRRRIQQFDSHAFSKFPEL